MKKSIAALSLSVILHLLMLPFTYANELDDAYLAQTTLGQLCKTSDFVLVGALSNAVHQSETRTEYTWRTLMVLTGNITTGTTVSVVDCLEPYGPPKKQNARYLVFGAHKCYPLSEGMTAHFKIFNFEFERERLPEGKFTWLQNGGSRGIIPVTPETEQCLLKTVTDYLAQLRSLVRNKDNYYEFLCGLLGSDVERVREDAKIDLKIFIRLAEQNKLEHIKIDGRLDNDLRAYAEKILNWNKQRQLQ